MNICKKPLIIITGATAVGKTDISVNLAKQINGEIISADSMQVYKGFNIGTAKISKQEMQGIRHYLIDELNPDEDFNVFEFQRRAKKYISDIWDNGHIPVIAGGTGFYIQSVLYDIDFSNEDNKDNIRKELEIIAENGGKEQLYEKLKTVDENAAALIHPNNVKRVIRALEYYCITGEQISVHNETQHSKTSPYDFVFLVLNRKREELYSRINKRIDIMISQGLVEEVKSLLSSGVSEDCQPMQGLGYKEIRSYLKGNITLEEAVELLKKNTRHFAKRQITWFKREPKAIWLNYEDTDDMLKTIMELVPWS